MMVAQSVFSDEALAFAEAAENARDPDEVIRRLLQVLGEFGLSNFGIASLPLAEQPFENLVIAQSGPPEWIDLYVAQQFFKSDPLVACLRGSIMFAWRAADFVAGRRAGAGGVMRRRIDFGIRSGLLVPIPRRDGLGFAAMSGDRPELDARSKPLVHLVAIYALDRLRDLVKPGRGATVLTAREKEVLTWIAAGKSAWEIGQILRIAKRTVDEHAQVAARKLGAVNRTQAVAIALRDRVIAV